MPDQTRLYISPLTPALLPAIIPAASLPTITEVSYHHIQTVPERSFGYIALSSVDAGKIRNKLNGTLLKGCKMKVEEAREDKKLLQARKGIEGEDGDLLSRKTSRKRKRTDGVLLGFELPRDRRVKRGWTESSMQQKSTKQKRHLKNAEAADEKRKCLSSAFTEASECLFITKAPPNKMDSIKKSKKDTKKQRDSSKEPVILVHEFKNTTKHASFLRNDGEDKDTMPVSEYDPQKGWIDRTGRVVEKPSRTRQTTYNGRLSRTSNREGSLPAEDTKEQVNMTGRQVVDAGEDTSDDETSSAGTSEASEEDGLSSDIVAKSSEEAQSDANSSHETTQQSVPTTAMAGIQDRNTRKASHNIPRSSEAAGKSPPALHLSSELDMGTGKAHPLETLFKKPKSYSDTSGGSRKPNIELKIPFRFFDQDGVDSEQHTLSNGNQISMPQTPFTRRDLEWRQQRSAAPTPDTAHPRLGGFGMPWIESDDENGDGKNGDDGENDAEETSNPKNKQQTNQIAEHDQPDSSFAKWFWEHRGETNRAWKRRGREARKEKRQRRQNNALP